MIIRFSILSMLTLVLAGCDFPSEKPEAANETTTEAPKLPEVVSFNEHIQPILSEYCYHCHGPDDKTRRPKARPLRLDRVEDAFALREDGRPVIIKGNPADSKLHQLIASADPDTIMPPPKSKKSMKPVEIALIKRWIEQGAPYENESCIPVFRSDSTASDDGSTN